MASSQFLHPVQYKNFNQFQTRSIEKCLQRYGDYIQNKKSKILDVGCGDGYVTENVIYPFFNNGNTEIIGTDISKEMIEFAQKNNINNSIYYQVMDITEKPPVDYLGKFDLIVSNFCLMYTTKYQREVNLNMYNMLQPNGQIFLIFLSYTPVFLIYKTLSTDSLLQNYMEDVDEIFPLYYNLDNESKKKWYCDRLESSGFKVNLCEIEKAPHTYPSIQNYRGSMEAINVFRIPNHLKDYFYQLHIKEAKRLGEYSEVDRNEAIKFECEMFVIAATKI